MIWDREEQKDKDNHTAMQNYINYLSIMHAHPLSDSDARKKFTEFITPKQIESNKASMLQSNQTDINQLKQLKALQDAKSGGGNNGND